VVEVYFAHGIHFTFENLTKEEIDNIRRWCRGYGDAICTIEYKGKMYYLNRDYVCAVVTG
jgi:hypothetical protein